MRLSKSFLPQLHTFLNNSKLAFLSVSILLILGSSYLSYSTYQEYSYLESSTEYKAYVDRVKSLSSKDEKIMMKNLEMRKSEHKILFSISFFVLLTSLFILMRRTKLFKKMNNEKENLSRLLKDIELYPDQSKAKEFKEIIKSRNSAKIYAFMSEMIEELQENKELADEANKTKSLFLANMSHEIRTPLNGIVGFTKFLKTTSLSDEQDEFVQIIRKSSEDLLSIINDILDISKIENGHIELEEVFFNPMEEFENVIESYAANASKKDIDFSLWIDPSFSTLLLRSDPGKIKQVLINLISNAVKFTDKKGKIDVIIEKVDSSSDDTSVKFTVKDNGIGISKEQEEKVFEAFSQADSSTSRKFGGTGLGLTISTGIVDCLGGALQLESTLGQGSIFHFTLNMSQKKIKREVSYKALKMAIYAPSDVQLKDSDHYLEDYLLTFDHLSMARFKTFDACMNARSSDFDVLYIHYDNIDKNELNQIVRQHQSYSSIVLVTKLNKRNDIQDISSNFTQILYEPITFSKVEKSYISLAKIIKDESTAMTNSKNKEKSVITTRNQSVSFNNLHALVVEDNPINQKMIQYTLKNMGITTECANNGKEGVDMFIEKKNYDVIFMDIQMPVMNGIDATKEILAYEREMRITHTPIIAVTANALKGDRERFLEEGMDEYVSKPIDLEKFVVALKKFFPANNEPIISNTRKDILLYKQTTTEAKIISAILKKLNYSVEIADNIEELKKVIDVNSYKCIILDKVHSDITHSNLTQQIKAKKIPSLLFIDGKSVLIPSDEENYTFVADKLTDYMSIKEKVDYMIDMDRKAS